MQRRPVILRGAAVACLGGAALMAVALAWPASRERIEVSLSGEGMQSAWIPLGATDDGPEPSPVPSLSVAIDLPRGLLLGREDELALRVTPISAPGEAEVYSLVAAIVSTDSVIMPSGESGQALRAGAGFEWTIVPRQAPQAEATLLLRLRRHSPEGVTEAERLVLARDIVFPVRTVVGLSAPVARLVAAVFGLCGALLGIASALLRTR